MAVSSGSTGSALLLNPRAVAGVGAVVNGSFDPGKAVAYPASVSEAILAKIGPAPPRPAGGARYDASVTWAERVLREYVLPELTPDVVINWLTEPDPSQHHVGVGSPESRAALRHDDAEIARVLESLEDLGLADRTDVLVASDHGFSTNTGGVDVTRALVEAGLKAAPGSADVILASSGQAVALHVRDRDGERIARIARFVQSRDWGGVVFSAGRAPGEANGVAPGTFALDLIHAASAERGADLLITFPWTSAPNVHGVPGTDLACVSGGARLYASDHGSLSPWNVRNTLFAWGPGFKQATTVPVAAGNVDVTPTILTLLGLDGDAGAGLDGRVLAEALVKGPDPEQVAQETRVHRAGRRLSRRGADLHRGRPPLRRQGLARRLSGPAPAACRHARRPEAATPRVTMAPRSDARLVVVGVLDLVAPAAHRHHGEHDHDQEHRADDHGDGGVHSEERAVVLHDPLGPGLGLGAGSLRVGGLLHLRLRGGRRGLGRRLRGLRRSRRRGGRRRSGRGGRGLRAGLERDAADQDQGQAESDRPVPSHEGSSLPAGMGQ